MRKRILTIALSLILVFCCSVPAFASDPVISADVIKSLILKTLGQSFLESAAAVTIMNFVSSASPTLLASAGLLPAGVNALVAASAVPVAGTLSIAIPAVVIGSAAVNIYKLVAASTAATAALAASQAGAVVSEGVHFLAQASLLDGVSLAPHYLGRTIAASILLGTTAVSTIAETVALYRNVNIDAKSIYDCPLPVFFTSDQIQAELDDLEAVFADLSELNRDEVIDYITENCPYSYAAALTEKSLFFFSDDPVRYPVSSGSHELDMQSVQDYYALFNNPADYYNLRPVYYGGIPTLDGISYEYNFGLQTTMIPSRSGDYTRIIPSAFPETPYFNGRYLWFDNSTGRFALGSITGRNLSDPFAVSDGGVNGLMVLRYLNSVVDFYHDLTVYNYLPVKTSGSTDEYIVTKDGLILPIAPSGIQSAAGLPSGNYFPDYKYIVDSNLFDTIPDLLAPSTSVPALPSAELQTIADSSADGYMYRYNDIPHDVQVSDISELPVPDLVPAAAVTPEVISPDLNNSDVPSASSVVIGLADVDPSLDPVDPDSGDVTPPSGDVSSSDPWTPLFAVPGMFADLFSKFLPRSVALIFTSVLFALVFYGLMRLFFSLLTKAF